MREGSAQESITYDYLVIATGCRLAFDEIEGFAEFGHTFSDTFYGNKVRNYLHNELQRWAHCNWLWTDLFKVKVLNFRKCQRH